MLHIAVNFTSANIFKGILESQNVSKSYEKVDEIWPIETEFDAVYHDAINRNSILYRRHLSFTSCILPSSLVRFSSREVI